MKKKAKAVTLVIFSAIQIRVREWKKKILYCNYTLFTWASSGGIMQMNFTRKVTNLTNAHTIGAISKVK